ncbi:hypothetical protein CACET_c22390 [Clostridium aceticum]|uniref:Uncharacterized protein n=1 Tax=Clostridium aceticum TaxID=84022 RepID=A0A0D8I9N9_9CLOT|nr:hypothetical protein [Clostridium aceticum]AKL95685.1 hypothetical protein CACET_c22390 [Clostridium aceticum]KJF26757.1 hypothetical protein TZ02_11070 [Clostridium aceticum]
MEHNDRGVIKGIIKGYNDAKLKFVKKFSVDNFDLWDETSFLDDGKIHTRINKLKKEYDFACKEVDILLESHDTQDQYIKEKLGQLMARQQEINLELVFLASNNMKNIDMCLNLLKDKKQDFIVCLYGLKEYEKGNKVDAFNYFYSYFKDKNCLLEHYLINKVYGYLLYEFQQFDKAVVFLQKACEKKPEDIEVHRKLKEVYKINKQQVEEKIQEKIITLLEG